MQQVTALRSRGAGLASRADRGCDAPGAPGLALLRLLQLVSPSLPVGGFTYSQGIEWAVEAGWLGDAGTVETWLAEQLHGPLATNDLALLLRLQAAASVRDVLAFAGWVDWLLATCETAELRAEETNRGRALAQLLVALGVLAIASSNYEVQYTRLFRS